MVSSTFISNHDRIIKRAQCSRLFSFFSVHRGCCGGLDIFRYLFGHLFGLILKFRVIFSISRNYFLISENLKNRTCIDFARSQWMKKHKIGSTRVHDVVIFIPRHNGHRTVTQSTCGQMCVFHWKIWRSIEFNMAFFDMFNSTEPVVPKYPIRRNKKNT